MSVVLSNPKATVSSGTIAVAEIDGTPVDLSVEKIKFSNDSLTVHGDGSVTVTTGVGGGDVTSNTGESVIGEVALFADTGGKVVKRSTLTGLLKSTSGVLQMAAPNVDYATAANPILTGNLRSTLIGTENILIDARTNPRDITLGVFRIEHTANVDGTRPITLDINANGYHTKALVIDYKATGLGAGSSHLHEINVDTSNSTAGSCHAIAVGKSGSGLIEVSALEVYPDVHPLLQKTGDPIPLTQAWTYSGAAFTDVTTVFNNGTNATLFVNDDDYVYCGADAAFSQLEIYLATFASNTISAIFQYSTGPGAWQTFSPADGTNGFTTNGSITWSGALAGWVAAPVNSVSKFYIRIQRTRNLLTISPVEQNIRIISSTDFGWDKNGDVTLHALTMTGVPVYADRSAAQAGGLATNQIYKTSAGSLMIV